MERAILKWAPGNWIKDTFNTSWNERYNLERNSEEFKQIQFEVRKALNANNKYISDIERNQNVYDFGQFLIRGQLLLKLYPYQELYQVRRYIKISNVFLDAALKNNIDHRRCNLNSITFLKHIPQVTSSEVLLIVQVLTPNPHSDSVSPNNSSDYYIEYIVRF